jgi:hypothetical protein
MARRPPAGTDCHLFAALEQGFAPYVGAFLPYLHPALKAHEDSQLCTVAVGLIGDITRSLGDQSAQYAGAFMSVLIENLQSEVLSRNVKISVLTCFGDIALAIGPAFEPYMDTAMGVLGQAGRVQPNPVSRRIFAVRATGADGPCSSTTTSSSTSRSSARASSRRTQASSPGSKRRSKVRPRLRCRRSC